MEQNRDDELIRLLKTLRAPIQQGEYDLHGLIMSLLQEHGIPFEHEVRLAPRCRIDLMVGSTGVEIKKGKPSRTELERQLARYAACERVDSLIAVVERTVDLPHTIGGKPVGLVCLNRLWGIAL